MSHLSPFDQIEELYQRYEALFEQGQFADCITLLDQDLPPTSRDGRYYSCRADAHLELAHYDQALLDYQCAIAYDSNDASSYINLGYIYSHERQFSQALAAYDTALKLAPEEACAHYNRGIVLVQLERLDEAMSAYTHAIACCPDFAEAYLNRGTTASRLGHQNAAHEDYEQAFVLAPADMNTAWTVNWSRWGPHGLDRQDIEHLQMIAQLCPADQHYVFFVCQAVACYQDDAPLALAYLKRAKQLEPDQWDPPFWHGLISLLQGDETGWHSIEEALRLGLPPLLLTPLFWLQSAQPTCFEHYARPLLEQWAFASPTQGTPA